MHVNRAVWRTSLTIEGDFVLRTSTLKLNIPPTRGALSTMTCRLPPVSLQLVITMCRLTASLSIFMDITLQPRSVDVRLRLFTCLALYRCDVHACDRQVLDNYANTANNHHDGLLCGSLFTRRLMPFDTQRVYRRFASFSNGCSQQAAGTCYDEYI